MLAACHHKEGDATPVAPTAFALSNVPPYIGDRKDSAEDALTVEGVALGRCCLWIRVYPRMVMYPAKAAINPNLGFLTPTQLVLG